MKTNNNRVNWRNFAILCILLTTLLFNGTSDALAETGEWIMTDSLDSARQWHTATTLQDGKVLIAGGQDFTSTLSSAELYDPSSGLWTPTGSMINGRYHHIAVLLQNGKVLVAGGQNNTEALSSAELYNPDTGLWEATSSLSIARNYPTATLLSDGKVLVTGGHSNGGTNLSTTEIYDPTSGTWTSSGSMNSDRSSHTATLLPNGKVLVTGGLTYFDSYHKSLASAELYDPDSKTWELITSMNSERYAHTATLLSNGEVLVAGGLTRIFYNEGCNWNIRTINTAELFNPVENTWEFTSSMSSVRGAHTANLLPDGKVLVTGGGDYVDQCGVEFHSYTINTSESFDPISESWVDIRTLNNARKDHVSASLPDGSTLIAGGWYENAPTSYSYSSAEYINFNLAPIADAGEDQDVNTLSSVVLDGSSSNDPDGETPISYQWTQIGGLRVTLTGNTTASPNFTAPDDPDILTFSLVVTDSQGMNSEPDEVVVTVNNQAPIADAGPDQSVKTLSTVTLDGSSSYDPDWDGYDDLIIGANQFSNGQSDEGRTFLYLGSYEGLLLDWTSESDQEEAYYGASVASAGDVNGDGFDDVIVGARLFDNEYDNAGKASLFYGSATGLSATEDWSVEGGVTDAGLGECVSTAGDVNGDGYDDVIVYINGGGGTGSVNVYYGSSTGLSTTPSWTQNSPQTGAQFGESSSTAGDVNGDGYDDVILGSFAYDNGQTNEGRAFVFHGSSSGLSSTADWIAESNLSNSWFGKSVASAGDVNGDGFDDVIVGAPYETSWTWTTEKGRAYIYHGSPSGLSTSPALIITSDQANAWLGFSVSSAGDINGDGFSDVIIGAYGYDNGQSNEGRAYVYFGSASGLLATPEWIKEGEQVGAQFGSSVAGAGDLNSDGFSDVVIGASTYDKGQNDEGCAFVHFGSSTGLSETPNWTGEGEQEGAQFGSSVNTAGNVNGFIPLIYQWIQNGGTTVTLIGDSTMNPTFSAPSNSDTLIFSLIVTDGLGSTSIVDTVTIEVESYKFFLPLVAN